VQFLTCERPDFIAPTLWSANSPDLSPVDYQIWGKLQEHVYRSRIRDFAQLKSRFIKEWEYFNQMISWLSMKQSDSDVHVFKLAFEHVKDILNTDFRYV